MSPIRPRRNCSRTVTGARHSAVARTHRWHCPAATSRSLPMRATWTIAPTAFSVAGCSMCASQPTPSRSAHSRPRSKKTIAKRARNFGPHNLHENRPGSFQSEELIFATYQNARVRVFDITDPFAPREVAHFVPPAPEKMVDPRPNRPRVIQSNDVYVAPDGLMYMTDVNDGLTILQYKG